MLDFMVQAAADDDDDEDVEEEDEDEDEEEEEGNKDDDVDCAGGAVKWMMSSLTGRMRQVRVTPLCTTQQDPSLPTRKSVKATRSNKGVSDEGDLGSNRGIELSAVKGKDEECEELSEWPSSEEGRGGGQPSYGIIIPFLPDVILRTSTLAVRTPNPCSLTIPDDIVRLAPSEVHVSDGMCDPKSRLCRCVFGRDRNRLAPLCTATTIGQITSSTVDDTASKSASSPSPP